MDDEMFAEISQGSFLPKASNVAYVPSGNLVAEPAKVMVLVDRPKESLFSRIKTYTFVGLVLSLVLYAMYIYMTWKSKPYEGRTLPGIAPAQTIVSKTFEPVMPSVVPTIDVALESKRLVATTMQQDIPEERPFVEPIFEDIVTITGPIPTWEVPEEPLESYEGRVDEHAPKVQDLVQSRERFNQQLEEQLAMSVKQQRNTTS